MKFDPEIDEEPIKTMADIMDEEDEEQEVNYQFYLRKQNFIQGSGDEIDLDALGLKATIKKGKATSKDTKSRGNSKKK